jgi:hypothetical protein
MRLFHPLIDDAADAGGKGGMARAVEHDLRHRALSVDALAARFVIDGGGQALHRASPVHDRRPAPTKGLGGDHAAVRQDRAGRDGQAGQRDGAGAAVGGGEGRDGAVTGAAAIGARDGRGAASSPRRQAAWAASISPPANIRPSMANHACTNRLTVRLATRNAPPSFPSRGFSMRYNAWG